MAGEFILGNNQPVNPQPIPLPGMPQGFDPNHFDPNLVNQQPVMIPIIEQPPMELVIELDIQYNNPEMPKLEKTERGDWIDLYTNEDVSMKAGDFKYIDLGVAIALPEGLEAIMAPRSSTFKHWGLLQANSIGIFDNSFCGPEDIWKFPAYATRDVEIPKFTRLCQFRTLPNQLPVDFKEVDKLQNPSRGGWGSSGR